MMAKFRILFLVVIFWRVITLMVACQKMEPYSETKVSLRQAQNAPQFYKPYIFKNCGLAEGYTASANQFLRDSWSYSDKILGISEALNFVSKDGKKTLKFSFPLIFKENSAYFTYSHWNLEDNSWNQLEDAGGVQITGTIQLAGKSYPIFVTANEIYVRHDGEKHYIELCGGNCMYRLNGIDVNSDFSMNLRWEEKR